HLQQVQAVGINLVAIAQKLKDEGMLQGPKYFQRSNLYKSIGLKSNSNVAPEVAIVGPPIDGFLCGR
ncbi:MAG TPA: hypothetical protein VM871_06405, partial [Flavisolibacter sp.]|nr:hypothetical protein [Flavisolibacter sp.]